MSENTVPFEPMDMGDGGDERSSDGTPASPALPTLRVQAMPRTSAPPGCHWWRFLDYAGEGELMNLRWLIETRDDMEGFWVVSPWRQAPTHERHIPIVAEEMRLAQQAIEHILGQVPHDRP